MKKVKTERLLKLKFLDKLEQLEPKLEFPHWTEASVPFSDFASLCQQLEDTSAHSDSLQLLSTFLLALLLSEKTEDFLAVVRMLTASITDSFTRAEFQLGDASVALAVSEALAISSSALKKKTKEAGDLAIVVQALKHKENKLVNTAPFSTAQVFGKLRAIAAVEPGKNAQKTRTELVAALLKKAGSLEAKFLVRVLQSKLRVGTLDSMVSRALAVAFAVFETRKLGTKPADMLVFVNDCIVALEQAKADLPHFGKLTAKLLPPAKISTLADASLVSPFVPLKLMLAEPAKSIEEVGRSFAGAKLFLEHKYDGERAQIHFADGKTRLFSRNCVDSTDKFFEVVRLFEHLYRGEERTFILDAEIVAVETTPSEPGDFSSRPDRKLLPFQQLMRRKKKPPSDKPPSIGVCVFVFDILFFDDCVYGVRPLVERKELLVSFLRTVPGRIELAVWEELEDAGLETANQQLLVCLKTAVTDLCEGLIVKLADGPDSRYRTGKRSSFWKKLKKDYLGGLADSFDLVLMGADAGKGKRTGVYGGFLMGAVDKTNGKVETVCKIGTGFSDHLLDTFAHKLKNRETKQKPTHFVISDALSVDVFFTGEECVWEVVAADLTKSPVHSCAKELLDAESGLALRFPRFIHERPDKNLDSATSNEEVLAAYNRQFA